MKNKVHLLFIDFMEKNGVLFEFSKRLYKAHKKNQQKFLYTTGPFSYISSAFSWSSSENYRLWSDLSSRWENTLEEHYDALKADFIETVFFSVLDANKALKKFMVNANVKSLEIDDMVQRLNNCSPDAYIGASFVWSETEEGEQYWKAVDTEWKQRLSTLL